MKFKAGSAFKHKQEEIEICYLKDKYSVILKSKSQER